MVWNDVVDARLPLVRRLFMVFSEFARDVDALKVKSPAQKNDPHETHPDALRLLEEST